MDQFEIYNQARLRRDPEFDGVFFVGVRTMGIYCRPICPARQPLTQNITFYPSAAAAEKAGLRACLRCRPETAPFCPAWNGTKSTINRAVHLIKDGMLEDNSVSELADRLGVGTRHLNRLFQHHLHVTPTQFHQTLRLQKAMRLLRQTDLSMTEVAYSSGFNSLRRFNAVFASVYRFPPTKIRNPLKKTDNKWK